MRELYIVNPSAGKNGAANFEEAVRAYHAAHGGEYEIIPTEYGGHATEIARAAADTGEQVRLWAVGGDGTLLEVARGAAGRENVSVGVFPFGSGNDFVRSFGGKEPFLDLKRQHAGKIRVLDMIRTDHGDAVNICSLGFDAKVAYKMARFKGIPGVSGSLAYLLSLFVSFFGKISDALEIEMLTETGETKRVAGRFIFALAGNARWYGGGFCGSPRSVPDDGLLDFVLILRPPLWKIPVLIGSYKAGKHLEDPHFAPYLTYCRGTKITLRGQASFLTNMDGNCARVDGEEHFVVLPGALRFQVPEGAVYGGGESAK